MALISEIRENRGIVEIVAEGATALRVRKAHFDKYPLTPGEDADLAAYSDRLAAAQFADAYDAALTSLDYSARTAREIAAALHRKGFVDPCVDAVIERLTENRLIDDARYAQRLAETQSGKAVGLYAFKRKLRAKGISDDDAQEALEAFDDEQQAQAAKAAAEKLWRKYESLPAREAKAKLSQALARRGFPWDAIESAIDSLMDE